jgi:hypothetical protein
MELTIKQKKLIEIAKQKGYLTYYDFQMFYASEMARKEAINRFLISGILKDNGNKFEYQSNEQSKKVSNLQ